MPHSHSQWDHYFARRLSVYTEDSQALLADLESSSQSRREAALTAIQQHPGRFYEQVGRPLLDHLKAVLYNPTSEGQLPSDVVSILEEAEPDSFMRFHDPFDDGWMAVEALRAIGSQEAFEIADEFWAKFVRPLERAQEWREARHTPGN